MAKFRKKPVIIEAQQFTDDPLSPLKIVRWCNSGLPPEAQALAWRQGHGICIRTLEGDHLAHEGDWIIKGVAGEFYPCKPDIFAETYEPVE